MIGWQINAKNKKTNKGDNRWGKLPDKLIIHPKSDPSFLQDASEKVKGLFLFEGVDTSHEKKYMSLWSLEYWGWSHWRYPHFLHLSQGKQPSGYRRSKEPRKESKFSRVFHGLGDREIVKPTTAIPIYLHLVDMISMVNVGKYTKYTFAAHVVNGL